VPSVTLAEAQARLLELIDQLPPGEELCITDNGTTDAKLVTVRAGRHKDDGGGDWALIDITGDNEWLPCPPATPADPGS
jgi:antitoxin (DNA-binding transcriptional repressor) of toxin-antitoxin stability system